MLNNYCTKALLIGTILSTINEHVNGQSIGFGRCPNVTVKQYFRVHRYTGKWYDVERISSTLVDILIGEFGDSCVSDTYGLDRDDQFITTGGLTVENTKTNWFEERVNRSLIAKPADRFRQEAKFDVYYKGGPRVGSYWILGTDYIYYSVVYECAEYWDLFHLSYVRLLSRGKKFNDVTRKIINRILQDNGISSRHLSVVNQENCTVNTGNR